MKPMTDVADIVAQALEPAAQGGYRRCLISDREQTRTRPISEDRASLRLLGVER